MSENKIWTVLLQICIKDQIKLSLQFFNIEEIILFDNLIQICIKDQIKLSLQFLNTFFVQYLNIK